MALLEVFGRRASHYTRVALMFAETLGVPYQLSSIPDMREVEATAYAGNPALKLPILLADAQPVFGALNICRAIAAHPAADPTKRVVWPESLADTLSRNAQELIWHCMAAQVQIVMGTLVCKLPADSLYFTKARAGLEGSLHWLDRKLGQVLANLPPDRSISVLETTLFCLVDHLWFRQTVPMGSYSALSEFASRCGFAQAAKATSYRLD